MTEFEPGNTVPDVVVRVGRAALTAQVTVNAFSMVADEPAELGGAEQGPDPISYVMVGLGSCTAITLRMYANHKQWPLEAVEVRVREAAPVGNAPRGHLMVSFSVCGDLTPAQLQRLEEVAARCPLHRALEAGFEVSTYLEQQ